MTLDEWLGEVWKQVALPDFADYEFPSDRHREEFLTRLDEWSDDQMRMLLRRFLITSASMGVDERHFQRLMSFKKPYSGPNQEFYHRLLYWTGSGGKLSPPWEGITWVLDLLPHSPRVAIDALDAYFLAHAQLLPDGRFRGLGEAGELIRAKYIGLPADHEATVDVLMNLNPRHFEHLMERLYARMGYSTTLTPASRDGGRDVIATRSATGLRDALRVECKRHRKPVGVMPVRTLLGVVSSDKATRGVLAASGTFTRGAIGFARDNPRIELLHGSQIVGLLNEHLGRAWPLRIETLVLESVRSARLKTG